MTEAEQQRYRIDIEYDGTDFVGWQVQPNGRSVQGVLEEALCELYGEPVRVHGAGRTDAGVHAAGQVAHFDAPAAYDAQTVRSALNGRLPADVTVRSAGPADPGFHARYGASSREYVYTVAHRRVSIDRRTVWVLYPEVDAARIGAAVECLHGTHDFTAFSKFSPELPHSLCHVFDCSWVRGGDYSRFHIKANRFLHGMVRCIVGGLVQVGRGKLAPEEFAAILASRDRLRSPMLAPPTGLTLTAVNYLREEWDFVKTLLQDLRGGD